MKNYNYKKPLKTTKTFTTIQKTKIINEHNEAKGFFFGFFWFFHLLLLPVPYPYYCQLGCH